MTAHIHAMAMADYSEDALKTDRPWELWEYYNIGGLGVWYDFDKHPQWMDNVKYRRKQKINLDNAPKKITPFKLLKQIDKKAAKYIKDSGFKKDLNKTKDLRCLFEFAEKAEGFKYWWETHEKLRKAIEEYGIQHH